MLFVNNRGEILENIDEKRFQLLKNSFSVYESEGIICQITFENRKIRLNVNFILFFIFYFIFLFTLSFIYFFRFPSSSS